MKYMTTVDGKQYTIEIDQDNEILVNDTRYEIDFRKLSDSGVLSLLINNRSFETVVDEGDEGYQVLIKGELYDVQVQDERAYRLAKARGQLTDVSGEVVVKSPMPGIVLKVAVQQGELVKKGAAVIILESMKMENELKAPRDGLISRVSVQDGASVEKGQPLVTIVDPDAQEE